MNIQLLSKKNTKPSIWSGGLTYEYMIYPKTAIYANRDFAFRISSATIEQTPSEFTKFKGYHRYLVMLDNDLDVEVNKEKKAYKKYEIMEFNSDDEVTSFTKGTDFNWMVSEKISHHKLEIANGNQNCNAEVVIVFSLYRAIITINEKPYHLEPYDVLVIENQEKENVRLHFSTECLFGILDF
ncbi:HutD family protein [Flavobacterium sp. KACC 22763]|uniref:HutD family protein n=1 Tax=Flavobacterium sp. KACC 22763 TaxID=3025668 RepID=UPI002367057B|nr:HutD family protein [Flavobacterium sp. KACC 22763]WDF65043.1 HutD family protein [Flavobacterium sp. KACC 22763]